MALESANSNSEKDPNEENVNNDEESTLLVKNIEMVNLTVSYLTHCAAIVPTTCKYFLTHHYEFTYLKNKIKNIPLEKINLTFLN